MFCFDFNNPEQLRQFYEGKCDKSISFECERKADALAVWFDVLLDEDLTISSSLFSEEMCCWDQAVFRFKEPQGCFSVKVGCGGGKLRFDLGQQSDVASTPTKSSTALCSIKTNCEICVSSEAILFLNNKKMQDSILSLPRLFDKAVNVLDLSPFPMLGLRFVKQTRSNLFCILKSVEEVKAVMEFSKNNDIDHSKIKCLRINELDEMIFNTCDKFDFIFNNLFETSGELKEFNINLIPRFL